MEANGAYLLRAPYLENSAAALWLPGAVDPDHFWRISFVPTVTEGTGPGEWADPNFVALALVWHGDPAGTSAVPSGAWDWGHIQSISQAVGVRFRLKERVAIVSRSKGSFNYVEPSSDVNVGAWWTGGTRIVVDWNAQTSRVGHMWPM